MAEIIAATSTVSYEPVAASRAPDPTSAPCLADSNRSLHTCPPDEVCAIAFVNLTSFLECRPTSLVKYVQTASHTLHFTNLASHDVGDATRCWYVPNELTPSQ